jgi:hypothetical protein
MGWFGHAACVPERAGRYKVLVGKPEGKRRLTDSGVDVRIILKWIFKE